MQADIKHFYDEKIELVSEELHQTLNLLKKRKSIQPEKDRKKIQKQVKRLYTMLQDLRRANS